MIKRQRCQEYEAPDGDDFDIPEELQKTLDGEQFFQKYMEKDDMKFIIFFTEQNLIRLDRAKYWIMDGTFSTTPLEYKQLYSIHGFIGNDENFRTLPLVYLLLNKKCEDIYFAALTELSEIASEKGLELNPKYILTDFEKAVVNALKKAFPHTENYGCYFHFSKSLLSKLGSLGLKSEF